MADNEIEITQEKSEALAERINSIKIDLLMMDMEYAKAVAESLYDKANWQDSAAVLNPMYDPEKSNILRKQADMLNHLIEFVEIGKQVDQMKIQAKSNESNMQKVMRMLM